MGISKKNCPKVIVLPHPFQSSQISNLIIRAWNQKFKGELPGCTVILDAKRSSNIISYFFETHSQALESLPYSDKKLDYLYKEFGITHIVVPFYRFSRGSIKTKTKIYSTSLFRDRVPEIDLFEDVYIDIRKKNIKTPKKPKNGVLSFFSRLLPNSVSLLAGSRRPSNTKEEKDIYNEESWETSSAPISPKFINLLPPLLLDNGASKLYFSSTIDYSADRITFVLSEKKDPSKKINYSLRYNRIIPSISMMYAKESLLGQFNIGLGAGLIIYDYKDSLEKRGSGAVLGTRIILNYRAFFTKNMFFHISMDSLLPNKAFISNDYFKISSDIGVFMGVGYYFNIWYDYHT